MIPTEGGLATALQELAFASNVDIVIDQSAVNVLPECRKFCEALGIDAWGLISSGALLATVETEYQDEVVKELRDVGVEARVIGRVGSQADSKTGASVLVRRDQTSAPTPIASFERDELARYFETDP